MYIVEPTLYRRNIRAATRIAVELNTNKYINYLNTFLNSPYN
jgi:hypothetical protein